LDISRTTGTGYPGAGVAFATGAAVEEAVELPAVEVGMAATVVDEA